MTSKRSHHMRLLVVLAFLSGMCIGAEPAFAGDPCPISFRLTDLGPLPWASDDARAAVKNGDPFFKRLVAAANKDEPRCRDIDVVPMKSDRLPIRLFDGINDQGKRTRDGILSALLTKGRRFRCNDAHRKLKILDQNMMQGGVVLFVRGKSRLMIVMPGWRTSCMSTFKADAMTDAQVLKMWRAMTRALVKNRHDNP